MTNPVKFHNVKIGASRKHFEGNNYIEIDGQRLRGVRKVEVKLELGFVPVVTVSFLSDSVKMDGEFIVKKGEDNGDT